LLHSKALGFFVGGTFLVVVFVVFGVVDGLAVVVLIVVVLTVVVILVVVGAAMVVLAAVVVFSDSVTLGSGVVIVSLLASVEFSSSTRQFPNTNNFLFPKKFYIIYNFAYLQPTLDLALQES
jgi:hypothetical protein